MKMVDIVVTNLQLAAAIDKLCAKIDALQSMVASVEQPPTPPPKLKKKRTRSAYNVHMSTELEQLKETHPGMGHRQRFALAVQTWVNKKQALADTVEKQALADTAEKEAE